MTSERALDPEGRAWVVRRKWVHRRLRWRGKRGARDVLDGVDLLSLADDLPVIGVILAAVGLLLVAIFAVMFIVPAIILIVELLIIGLIVGLGLTGRVLLGRPWTVEAQQVDAGHSYEWKVSGWRASRNLVISIADQLCATGRPTGGSPVPLPNE